MYTLGPWMKMSESNIFDATRWITSSNSWAISSTWQRARFRFGLIIDRRKFNNLVWQQDFPHASNIIGRCVTDKTGFVLTWLLDASGLVGFGMRPTGVTFLELFGPISRHKSWSMLRALNNLMP